MLTSPQWLCYMIVLLLGLVALVPYFKQPEVSRWRNSQAGCDLRHILHDLRVTVDG